MKWTSRNVSASMMVSMYGMTPRRVAEQREPSGIGVPVVAVDHVGADMQRYRRPSPGPRRSGCCSADRVPLHQNVRERAGRGGSKALPRSPSWSVSKDGRSRRSSGARRPAPGRSPRRRGSSRRRTSGCRCGSRGRPCRVAPASASPSRRRSAATASAAARPRRGRRRAGGGRGGLAVEQPVGRRGGRPDRDPVEPMVVDHQLLRGDDVAVQDAHGGQARSRVATRLRQCQISSAVSSGRSYWPRTSFVPVLRNSHPSCPTWMWSVLLEAMAHSWIRRRSGEFGRRSGMPDAGRSDRMAGRSLSPAGARHAPPHRRAKPHRVRPASPAGRDGLVVRPRHPARRDVIARRRERWRRPGSRRAHQDGRGRAFDGRPRRPARGALSGWMGSRAGRSGRASPPSCGEGQGRGWCRMGLGGAVCTTPTSNASPQGGGERVALRDLNQIENASAPAAAGPAEAPWTAEAPRAGPGTTAKAAGGTGGSPEAAGSGGQAARAAGRAAPRRAKPAPAFQTGQAAGAGPGIDRLSRSSRRPPGRPRAPRRSVRATRRAGCAGPGGRAPAPTAARPAAAARARCGSRSADAPPSGRRPARPPRSAPPARSRPAAPSRPDDPSRRSRRRPPARRRRGRYRPRWRPASGPAGTAGPPERRRSP